MAWAWIIAGLVLVVGSAGAHEALQTDWSGGGGDSGPVAAWADRFEASADVSYRSCPGQLALGSAPLAPALAHFVTSSFSASSLAAADVDGDGDPDVVGSSLQGTGRVGWWRNQDGSATVWDFLLIDGAFQGARGIQAGDVDGDGRLDVVGTGFSAQVVWWRNDGGEPIAWTKHVIASGFQGGNRLAVIDIDNDGDLDVIGVAFQIHDVRLWLNEGGSPPTWTEVLVDGSFLGVVDVHAADVDADGSPDIAAVAYDGDLVAWWRNLGGSPPAWERQTIATAFNGAHCQRIADIDNDGDGDVVAVAYFAGDLVWWRNEGGNPVAWTRRAIDLNLPWASDVRTGDIDGDGDIDVLATGYDSGRVSWWENGDGLGGTWAMHAVATGYSGAWPIELHDLDLDGDLDVLSCATWAVSIDWWEVTRFAASGHLTSSILDLGAAAAQASLDWDATQPPGTHVGLRIRCGDDPLLMGPWSPELSPPVQLPEPVERYVQYELSFASADPRVSPLVREVTLSWQFAADATGAGSPASPGLLLRPVNPACGRACLRLIVARPGRVQVRLFDACGRRIGEVCDRWFAAGEHILAADHVPNGVLLCRASSAGDRRACRVTVVR